MGVAGVGPRHYRSVMRIKDRVLIIALALGVWFGMTGIAADVEGKESLHVLLRRLVAENGGDGKGLPTGAGPEVRVRNRSKDSEGEQVALAGNQISNVLPALRSAFGEPAWNRTNQAGGVLIQYRAAQTGGIGLLCSSETIKGEGWTVITVINAAGLEAIAGKSKSEMPRRVETTEEIRARELAIKEAKKRGLTGELDAIATHKKGTGIVVTVFEKNVGPLGKGPKATVAISEEGEVIRFVMDGGAN